VDVWIKKKRKKFTAINGNKTIPTALNVVAKSITNVSVEKSATGIIKQKE